MSTEPTIAPRFWVKVALTANADRCWNWLAGKDQLGYGMFKIGGKKGYSHRAHRVSFELVKGQIPSGLEIDHICRNRGCVNPDHLRAVTHLENMRAAVSAGSMIGKFQLSKTHCPNGHEYSAENTYRPIRRNERQCIVCRTVRRHNYYKEFGK